MRTPVCSVDSDRMHWPDTDGCAGAFVCSRDSQSKETWPDWIILDADLTPPPPQTHTYTHTHCVCIVMFCHLYHVTVIHVTITRESVFLNSFCAQAYSVKIACMAHSHQKYSKNTNYTNKTLLCSASMTHCCWWFSAGKVSIFTNINMWEVHALPDHVLLHNRTCYFCWTCNKCQVH